MGKEIPLNLAISPYMTINKDLAKGARGELLIRPVEAIIIDEFFQYLLTRRLFLW